MHIVATTKRINKIRNFFSLEGDFHHLYVAGGGGIAFNIFKLKINLYKQTL